MRVDKEIFSVPENTFELRRDSSYRESNNREFFLRVYKEIIFVPANTFELGRDSTYRESNNGKFFMRVYKEISPCSICV